MKISQNEIAGYAIGEKMFCCDCASKEANDAASDQVINREDIDKDEEHAYFCDGCKKQF